MDEQTFARVFGPCDWAVMAIVAWGGQTHARLRFNAGPGRPGGDLQMPVAVDYMQPFAAADHAAWEAAYQQHVQPVGELMDFGLENLETLKAAELACFDGLGGRMPDMDEQWGGAEMDAMDERRRLDEGGGFDEASGDEDDAPGYAEEAT